MIGVDAEIESLRASVTRFFQVTQIVVNPFAITFHVAVDPKTMDASFDGLRKDLVPRNYVPSIVREGTETVLHVQKRPEPRFRSTHVNLLLLIATIGTTWVAGAVNWQSYTDVPLLSVDAFVWGFVSFTVPLLLILGAHEMGHYLTAKRHSVRASLPFFIPSVPILGTFGAFISMRDPIPNRKALLEIGLSGPLIGFLIAVPITVLGLSLGGGPVRPPPPGGGEITMPSLLFGWLQGFFPNAVLDPFRRHPTAFAGWVGLFVTAINLLPAGQLDGGHIARALLGERHRYFSWGAVIFLFILGFGFGYAGWILFGLLVLLLGTRHPPPLNDITALTPSRRALGVLAIAILLITFVPTPFVLVPANAAFAFESTSGHAVITELTATIAAGTARTIAVDVNNTGNVAETVGVWIDPQNLNSFGWSILIQDFVWHGDGTPQTVSVSANQTRIALNATEYATLHILVQVPAGASSQVYSWAVLARIEAPDVGQPFVQQLPVRITVV